MNTRLSFSPSQIWQSLNGSLNEWLLAPTRQVYTCEDWIGEPDEDIASYALNDLPGSAPLPEIDPDEFESDYVWFLS